MNRFCSCVLLAAVLSVSVAALNGGAAWATENSKLPAGANHARAHQAPHMATGAGVNIAVLEENDGGIAAVNSNLGTRLQAQFNYAAKKPSDLATVGNITVIGGGDTHMSLVANTAAGSVTGSFVGVAPGANVTVGGLATAATSTAEDFDALRLATLHLSNRNVSLYNISYNLDVHNTGTNDGSDNPALYADWFQHNFDALIVKSAGNKGLGSKEITQPGTMFNGIVVGDADGNARAADSSYHTPADNGTSPDLRGLPHIMAPGTNIGDSHTTQSGTSFAAPHVTGTAALLMENGLDLPGPANRNHLAIKSLILNSARKRNIVGPENTQASSMDNAATGAEASDANYLNGNALRVGNTAVSPKTADWTPTQWTYDGTLFSTNRPLDDEQGTGLLDAERALINMDGGEQEQGLVSEIGWNRDAVMGNSDDIYTLDFAFSAGDFITTTLTWDRIVDSSDGDIQIEDSDTYSFNSLADLDLEIYFQDSLIAESAGVGGMFGENVEHLHIPLPYDGKVGDYTFRVENNGGSLIDYGLAWWTEAAIVPEPSSILMMTFGIVGFGFMCRRWQRVNGPRRM